MADDDDDDVTTFYSVVLYNGTKALLVWDTAFRTTETPHSYGSPDLANATIPLTNGEAKDPCGAVSFGAVWGTHREQ